MLQDVKTKKSGGMRKFPPQVQNSAWADAVERAKHANMIDLAGQVVELRRASGREMQGPCPKCGGDDRLHVKADGWFCRQCKPIDAGGHGWHDPISWITHTSNVTFDDAVTILTGVRRDGGRTTSMPSAPVTMTTPVPIQTPAPQTDEWRAKAVPVVEAAQAALLEDGNPGAAYLLDRGLLLATCIAFGFGFGAWRNQPAILIPWYRAGKLQALRYRILNPADGTPKNLSEPGSKFAGVLFGGQAMLWCAEHLRTLVICEGEINAASIWQAAHESAVDVLSLGSESATLPKSALEYAAKFRTCIIWMDKLDIARKWAEQIPGATAVASPGGMDANDLLRAGKLAYFLAAARLKACKSDHERAALKWDIWDMHNLYGGVDDRTVELCEGI